MRSIHPNPGTQSSLYHRPCHQSGPPPPHIQVTLLALISLITVGSHYGKHSLASLGPEIIHVLGIQRSQFGLLFSSEEIPGIILPVVGGFALTYIPHGPAAVALSASILVATSLCAIAVTNKSYTFLFLGRFMFGLFDGALTTLQGAFVAYWFRRRISSSFGITLLVSRTSSFLGLSLPSFISHNFGLVSSMWFSVAVCVPAFIASVLYAALSRRHEPPHIPVASEESQPIFTHAVQTSEAHNQRGTRGLRALVQSFPLSFWLICYLWTAVAGAVFSTVHFAPDAFSAHFGISSRLSGLLSGSIIIIGGLSSPAFGVLQDRIGHRALILACACVAICVGILVCTGAIGPTFQNAQGRIVVILGLCVVAGGVASAPVTLMSSLALSVDDFAITAALGIYKATENAGLAVLHFVTGMLRDRSGDYTRSFLVLAALSGSGVVASVILGRTAPVLKLNSVQLAEVEGEE